jgi:hypothetical protein
MTPGEKVTVEIATISQDMAQPAQTGQAPKITMNGNAFPAPKGGGPYSNTGVQLAVLDPTMDITSPAAIRTNQFIAVQSQNGSWMSSYHWTWAGVVRQLLTSGDPDQQLVLLATFGFDANMPPDSAALQLLMELGAGPQLQTWETTVDVGSQSGQWVAFPANYILIGNPSYGYGQATEEYGKAGQQSSVTTTASVTLTNAA